VVWVALEGDEGPLPNLGGRVPVRSMDINLGVEALASRFEGQAGPMIAVDSPYDISITVQPSTNDASVIHVLAARGHDLKLVSRHMEQLRSELEAEQ